MYSLAPKISTASSGIVATLLPDNSTDSSDLNCRSLKYNLSTLFLIIGAFERARNTFFFKSGEELKTFIQLPKLLRRVLEY